MFKKLIEWLRFGRKRKGLVDYHSDNNFGSQAVYTPNKSDLEQATKETFIVFNPKLLDQYDSDFCVAYGGAYEADATEDFDGESEQGSGAFLFACAKKYSNTSIKAFGTTLLAGCMARVKYGICNKEQYDYKRGMRDWFATFSNIPEEAFETAEKHKAGSAWQLAIPWNMTKFDAIVSTLYHFKEKKVLIGTGNNAHRITVIGYDKPRDCLICADTYGERTYNKGTRFISRTEAKTLFTSYFVLDIERELAEILVQYDRKVVKIKDNVDCYYISGGEKHSLVSEKIAWSHGFLLAPNDEANLTEIITRKDLEKIPEGEPLTFEGGKNEWIIRRIYEKNKIID